MFPQEKGTERINLAGRIQHTAKCEATVPPIVTYCHAELSHGLDAGVLGLIGTVLGKTGRDAFYSDTFG